MRAIAKDFGLPPPRLRLADVTTSSLVAFRFYVEGLASYYQGAHQSAGRLFKTALAEGAGFAMAAHYAAGSTPIPESWALRERAVRFSAHTTDRERLLIRGSWAAAMDEPRRLAIAETLAVRYPAEPDGHLLLGQALLWGGHFSGAVARFERLVQMDSVGIAGSPLRCRACQALDGMATAYGFADSLAAAERVARRWARLQPLASGPWVAVAYALEGQAHYDEATAALRTAEALEKQDDAHLGHRLGIRMRQGEFASGDRLWRERLENGSRETKEEALWGLTISYRAQGRLREALHTAQEFRRPASQTPAPPETRIYEGIAEAQVLFEMGRFREAAALFDSIAAVSFTDRSPARNARQKAWALTHAATALAAAGDTARVRALVDTVRFRDEQSAYAPDRRLHHHVRGLYLLAQNRPAEAAGSFEQALFSPRGEGYVRTALELDRARIAAGEPRRAIPVLRNAVRGFIGASGFYATKVELHEQLGRAYEAAGQPDSAAAEYRWVLSAWERADPRLDGDRKEIGARIHDLNTLRPFALRKAGNRE